MGEPGNPLIDNLERMNPLRQSVLRQAVESLHLPPGSQGLDIGCGTGDQSVLLAEAVSPAGTVTGLDISQPVLAYAQEKVAKSLSGVRVNFMQGDMDALPFERASFDWVWSVDCVGYPAADLLPILLNICQLVRPGGIIAILAWSSQQLLPGFAMLEAKLNATCSPYAPYLEGRKPDEHFMKALHWFPPVGIHEFQGRTFVGHIQAPLDPGERQAMAVLFEMLWGNGEGLDSSEEKREYCRLCSPESPDFIADLPDYYGFFTYTMFTGRITPGT